MRKVILFFLFLGFLKSLYSQKIFDPYYYYIYRFTPVPSAQQPLVQFQVRFSAIALMNDRSPVYYRLKLAIPIRRNKKTKVVILQNDSSLHSLSVIYKNRESKTGVSKYFLFQRSFVANRRKLLIDFSQSIFRTKIEIWSGSQIPNLLLVTKIQNPVLK